MALTTKAKVLQRLGLGDDEASYGALLASIDLGSATSIVMGKSGDTGVSVNVDGGGVTTYLFSNYPTIGELAVAITSAELVVELMVLAGVDGSTPCTLLANFNVTLYEESPSKILSYTNPFAATDAALIEQLIAEVDCAIGRHCNRMDGDTGGQTFESAPRDEKYDGANDRVLSLRNWPVTAITQVGIIDANGTETALASADYRADTRAGLLYWNAGGYSVAGDWWSNGAAPQRSGWPVGFQNLRVQYTAGYATVPPDLAGVATQMVVDLYLSRKTNRQHAAQSIGDSSKTFRSADDLAALYGAMLAPHRRIAV